jgi:plasmid replication initiation protein
MRVSTNFMPHQLDILKDYKNWDSMHNWIRKFYVSQVLIQILLSIKSV